jgi:hypothetical protein
MGRSRQARSPSVNEDASDGSEAARSSNSQHRRREFAHCVDVSIIITTLSGAVDPVHEEGPLRKKARVHGGLASEEGDELEDLDSVHSVKGPVFKTPTKPRHRIMPTDSDDERQSTDSNEIAPTTASSSSGSNHSAEVLKYTIHVRDNLFPVYSMQVPQIGQLLTLLMKRGEEQAALLAKLSEDVAALRSAPKTRIASPRTLAEAAGAHYGAIIQAMQERKHAVQVVLPVQLNEFVLILLAAERSASDSVSRNDERVAVL